MAEPLLCAVKQILPSCSLWSSRDAWKLDVLLAFYDLSIPTSEVPSGTTTPLGDLAGVGAAAGVRLDLSQPLEAVT